MITAINMSAPKGKGGAMSRVIVLGSCAAWPEPGRACSGFVVEHNGQRIVLDLGFGTLARLLALPGGSTADGIAGVIITHEHVDHCVDLHGLFRVRWYSRRETDRIPLFAPEGVIDALSGLDRSFAAHHEDVFDWTPLPAGPQEIGAFTLSSHLLPHDVRNAGIRLSSPELTIAYTGDTGADDVLVDLGRDADLFIVEATDARHGPLTARDLDPNLHLTAERAGAFAESASAKRLLLTHFWPGIDREQSRRDATADFTGMVILAEEDLEIELG